MGAGSVDRFVKTFTVTGTTSSTGNLSLGTTIPEHAMVTASFSASYVGITFYNGTNWYVKVMNRTSGTQFVPVPSTSVTVRVYYLEF